MVEFVCDDKDIEKNLRKLHKQVTANGGIVHDKLTIGCKNGDFKISVADSVPNGEKIIILPKECLLPVKKYKLGLKGNDIILKSYDKDLSEAQVSMMETTIELYNLTGKIESQKKTSTFSLYYKDRGLFDLIFKARDSDKIPFIKKTTDKESDEFYLDSFIKTRVLGFKEVSDEGVKGEGFQRTQVLMPIIDFINHHSKATGFLSRFSELGSPDVKQSEEHVYDEDGISVAKTCPVEGSDECYVYYGPYDSMDTFIHYNYVDKSVGFMRSVPMTIKLPGGVGTIEIRSATGSPQHKKLPEQLKDLAFFIPGVSVDAAKEVVTLGYIYIPPKRAPRSMRRVLALAINHLGSNLSEMQAMEAVMFAEKYIINENLKYFEELRVYMEGYKAKPAVKLIAANAKDVAVTQLENIKRYNFFDETQMSEPKKARA